MNFVCNPSTNPPPKKKGKIPRRKFLILNQAKFFLLRIKCCFWPKIQLISFMSFCAKTKDFAKIQQTQQQQQRTESLPSFRYKNNGNSNICNTTLCSLNNLDHTPAKTGKYLTTYIKRGGKGKKRLITN